MFLLEGEIDQLMGCNTAESQMAQSAEDVKKSIELFFAILDLLLEVLLMKFVSLLFEGLAIEHQVTIIF